MSVVKRENTTYAPSWNQYSCAESIAAISVALLIGNIYVKFALITGEKRSVARPI